jgi:hypothetical protein
MGSSKNGTEISQIRGNGNGTLGRQAAGNPTCSRAGVHARLNPHFCGCLPLIRLVPQREANHVVCTRSETTGRNRQHNCTAAALPEGPLPLVALEHAHRSGIDRHGDLQRSADRLRASQSRNCYVRSGCHVGLRQPFKVSA